MFVSGIRTLHRRYGNDRALSHSLGTLSVSKVHAAEPTTVRRRIRPTPSRVGEARRRSKKELRGTCGFSSTSQSHGRRACGPCSVNAIENRVDKIPPRSLYRIQSKCSVHLRFVTKKSRCSLFTWLLSNVCVCGGGTRRVLAHAFPGSAEFVNRARREERLQLPSRKRSRRMVGPRGGRAASGGQQADR